MATVREQAKVEAARTRTEALYRLHGHAVSQICRALLRDRIEAEDATQQVFLSVHRALLGGAAPREPTAWLFTIARHECWARRKAHTTASDAVASRAANDVADDALQNAELALLWNAIAELPPAQREAVLLREIRGLSYVQLARELAVSGPAARSLLGRARRRIRLRLRDIHAGLGGLPWLDALARLSVNGSSPAAPVRAAALGLGAAAVAGGALVTSTPVAHHARPASAAATAHATHVAVQRHVERHAPRRPSVRAPRIVVRTRSAPSRPKTASVRVPERKDRTEHRRGRREDGRDVGSGSRRGRAAVVEVAAVGDSHGDSSAENVAITPPVRSDGRDGGGDTRGSESHSDHTSASPSISTETTVETFEVESGGTGGDSGSGGGEHGGGDSGEGGGDGGSGSGG